jgi:ectoine hydroxylase-related dioxygenase (phytanoyl-CoA dioxygenase family)
MIEMSEREKFLMDLQGFLHVKDFLSTEEVRALNEAVDANVDEEAEDFFPQEAPYGGGMDGQFNKGTADGMLTWEQPWCQPFRDMLAHPKLIPYLNTFFGRGWRMDEQPFISFAKKGTGGHGLHGTTNRVFDSGLFYHYGNGQIRTGLAVFQFQLADINPGDGGIAVIPGSHKANFKCPEDIMLYSADREVVRNVASKAGDMVIFLEATIHGALPWTAEHNRRSLFYRYGPKYLNFHSDYIETSHPEWVSELTDVQRAALEPAHAYDRPLVGDDGASLVQTGNESVAQRPRKKDTSAKSK